MTIVLVLAATYAAICVAAFVFQEKLIFFPDRALVATPEVVGLDFEDVRFESDGGMLSGWFLPSPAARGTMLFFHGNAGNISHRLDSLQLYHQLGLNVLIFDYRGYGESRGRTTEGGVYQDARAAWRYLLDERSIYPNNIVLFGRSLGGAVAVELATEVDAAGLIVESTFTNVPEMGAVAYPWLPVRWLSRIRFDTRSRITEVDCPKLFIHSSDDELIPYEQGCELYAEAHPPKYQLTMNGSHNDGYMASEREYRDAMDRFLIEIFGNAQAESEAAADWRARER